MMSLVSALAGQVFLPTVVEAAVFTVCLGVSLKIIELVRAQINLKQKGGE